LSLYELSTVPSYVASKMRLYAGVVAGRKVGWIRSKRDAK
jgi:hypothetical protein